jgi:hypothetical protein
MTFSAKENLHTILLRKQAQSPARFLGEFGFLLRRGNRIVKNGGHYILSIARLDNIGYSKQTQYLNYAQFPLAFCDCCHRFFRQLRLIMKATTRARSTIARTNRVMSSTSSTTRPNAGAETIVDLLLAGGRPKAWAERALAEMAQGIVTCIANAHFSVFEAWDELFDIANYDAIRRHRLNRNIAQLFEWGMELSTVARNVPGALTESLDEMTKLAAKILRTPRGKRAA